MLDKLLNKEDVLKYVQFKGPLIPVHLVSLLKSNTIMIGAALSELASDGKVKISHMKVGGSPLYFVDSQRAKLQDFYKYLNEKDRRTFDELKRQKVLRDSVVTPLLRISLRNIKDFAVPIEIEHNSVKELFWRWYLLDKQEAVGIIKSLLFINSVKKEEIRKETAVETTGKSAEIKQTSAIQQATQNPAVKAENPESNIAKKKEKTEKVADRQERQKVEEFIKPMSLSLRLFGNILGEDALIGAFVMLGIAALHFMGSPVGLPIQTPFMLLAIITGTIQALVFTMLTTIYIASMLPHEEEHH